MVRHNLITLGCIGALAIASMHGAMAQTPPARGTSSEVDNAVRQGAFATAAALLEKAALAGNAEAQYQLASLYRSGRGVDQDDALALKWMKAAAAQDHVKAQFNLGKMYLSGRAGPADVAAAKPWLQKAAARGHAARNRGWTLVRPAR